MHGCGDIFHLNSSRSLCDGFFSALVLAIRDTLGNVRFYAQFSVPMMTPTPNPSLSLEYPELKLLRQRIDALDEEMVQLLIKRMQIVREVGELKRSQGEANSFIRPDREALMLRNLMTRFRGTDFPESAAAAIWRIIIGASTSTESPLNLSIAHGLEEGSAVALAREYFGPNMPCRLHNFPDDVLSDLQEDVHCIGVFTGDYPPSPRGTWWQQLALSSTTPRHVFARLPFVLYRRVADSQPVFLVGSLAPAPTGDDATLLMVEADITPTLREGWSVLQTSRTEHGVCSLLEVTGWNLPESDGFTEIAYHLQKTLAGTSAKLHFLGAYAQPFTVNS